MRVLISQDPPIHQSRYLYEKSPWPALWVGHPEQVGQAPVAIAYRRRFSLDRAERVRVHVTADERYELYVDGRREGRGPERGDKINWFYETYDVDLSAGEHVIVARTWWLGPDAPSPHAQVTVRPGFFLMADEPHRALLSTGMSDWECKVLAGHAFEPPQITGAFCAVGARVVIDGETFPWGFERGEGDGWGPVKPLAKAAVASYVSEHPPEWVLRPALLPAMMEEPLGRAGTVRHVSDAYSDRANPVQVRNEAHRADDAAAWQRLLDGQGALTIGAGTTRRVLVDLDDYYCAYPELTTTGGRGATVRVFWAESLYQQPEGHSKGNRGEVDGKFFNGMGDTFKPDGGRSRVFNTLWWEAGRYIEITVRTADEPLTIERFQLRETRYPLALESRFESSDPRLAEVTPIALRTLEMCAHETYFDCPYYEQLMYSGDTRLHALVTYATSRDDRLPRKAIEMFDASRLNGGLTEARYPSRVRQVIPTFSLWWVGMVHDYALWRDDAAFVADRMPGVRAVLEPFRAMLTDEGLLRSPDGWSFVDWVPEWRDGMPKGAYRGINGTVNALLVYALRRAAELEEWSGEPELAARNRRTADSVAQAASNAFWDETRGLLAEDREHTQFSEHAQCLALLGDMLDGPRRSRATGSLFAEKDVARATIFFTHYLFETCRITGRMDVLHERLGTWFDLKRYGFKTTFEMPEPTRSDCHAWGAHPVYHYFATILGIRPASPGFRTVRIEPQLGGLAAGKGTMVHPRGDIVVDVTQEDGRLRGAVTLPHGVSGLLVANGGELRLRAGRQRF